LRRHCSIGRISTRDVFEASMLKAKARHLQGQGQAPPRPRPRPNVFEAKVKAAVFEVNEVLTLRQQAD